MEHKVVRRPPRSPAEMRLGCVSFRRPINYQCGPPLRSRRLSPQLRRRLGCETSLRMMAQIQGPHLKHQERQDLQPREMA